jgi:hypothetical protein
MADIIVDGKVKVWHVVSIANRAAPTTAELNAGTQLEMLLTTDGLVGFQPETAEVDTSALGSTFNTKKPGRDSYTGTRLRLKKAAGTDALYNTLVKDFVTHIVVRRNGSTAATAWASTNAVEVYPVTCGQVANVDIEENTLQRYEIPVLVSEEPNLRAVVA